MKKWLQKRLKNEKGLTLVELLAVIVILGIIAAIAVPSIGNVIEKSKENAVRADALNILAAADLYLLDNPGAAEVKVSKLVTEGYLDSAASFKADTAAAVNITASTTTNQSTKTFTGTGKVNDSKNLTFTNATKDAINAKDSGKSS